MISWSGATAITATTTAGLTTGYAYNPAGQLQTLTLPGSRVITYAYTPVGQVAGITDSQGNAISYTYDSEGRRTGEEVHDPHKTMMVPGFQDDKLIRHYRHHPVHLQQLRSDHRNRRATHGRQRCSELCLLP
jgi:YD repeat-containing protein